MTDARDTLRLTSNAEEMDVDAIHAYLDGESYWARGIPRETVARAVRNSLCFGVFDGAAQVAFTRVVTDRATYAYLCDVYVLEPYRGRGIGKRMVQAALAHPELHGLRRWGLATHDAHGLYAQFGFTPLAQPERFMERTDRRTPTSAPPRVADRMRDGELAAWLPDAAGRSIPGAGAGSRSLRRPRGRARPPAAPVLP